MPTLPLNPSESTKRRNPALYRPQSSANAPQSNFDSKKASGQPKLEKDLHNAIESDLKARRLYYVHSRTDRATTTALGVPDFIIALPSGKTLWLEIKRKGAKLTKEQNIVRHILKANDHLHFVIYSFEEYTMQLLAANILP